MLLSLGQTQVDPEQLQTLLGQLHDLDYRRLLRREMEDAGITQIELSDLTGIPRNTLGALLREFQTDDLGRPRPYYPNVVHHTLITKALCSVRLALWPLAQSVEVKEDGTIPLLDTEALMKQVIDAAEASGRLLSWTKKEMGNPGQPLTAAKLTEIFELAWQGNAVLSKIAAGAKESMKTAPFARSRAGRAVHGKAPWLRRLFQ